MIAQSEAGVIIRSMWQLDPAHTLVEFSGKHMIFTTIKGHFKIELAVEGIKQSS